MKQRTKPPNILAGQRNCKVLFHPDVALSYLPTLVREAGQRRWLPFPSSLVGKLSARPNSQTQTPTSEVTQESRTGGAGRKQNPQFKHAFPLWIP